MDLCLLLLAAPKMAAYLVQKLWHVQQLATAPAHGAIAEHAAGVSAAGGCWANGAAQQGQQHGIPAADVVPHAGLIAARLLATQPAPAL
jgi:hypothetical protein